MAKIFDFIGISSRPRLNKFDLSHGRKMTCDMGFLIPIMVQEILPGDRFRVSSEMMARLQPMLAPIMHKVKLTTHFFFCPNRLVWDEFEDFITGGRLGTSQPVHPYLSTETVANEASSYMINGRLWDYMGLPQVLDVAFPGGVDMRVSALPFRAYQLIYDEYYRDQNLSASLDISKASGEVTAPLEIEKLLVTRRRCWEKDYFTSALPFAQRGPEVNMPFGVDGYAPIVANRVNGGATSATLSGIEQPGAINVGYGVELDNDPPLPAGPPNLWADLSGADATSTITIEELRRTARLQEFLELMARAGSRYVETLKAFFDVTSDDARLQRPEYLGGGLSLMNISEVLQTVDNTIGDGEPLGTMAGHGFAIGKSNRFAHRFKEHGYCIGLLSIMPNTEYMDGIPKHFTRLSKLDYYWKQFAQLGEQEVRNSELFYNGNAGSDPAGTFGYQSRYCEYKYGVSTVHGGMRDQLDFWNMARRFTSEPTLNASFVESDPTNRIFAVQDADIPKVIVNLWNQVDALRPMPYFNVPKL